LGLSGQVDLLSWEAAGKWGLLPAGTKVHKGEAIFPRLDVEAELKVIDDFTAEARRKAEANKAKPENKETLEKSATAEKQPAGVAEITIDDFAKVELKVAEVIQAEAIPKADRLLKLILDLGDEQRQVVSGIALYYKPEELIGQKVICVTNLKPVTLRGVESHGMILAAKDGEILRLATLPREIPNGTIVK